MQINIKQLILEGYSYKEITEAVHANHSHLNKRRLKDPTTSYVEGKEIEKNRKKLADEIKDERNHRDSNRKRAADAVDPDPTGIIVNQEATCSINATGVSYVYLAIA